jgi:hypothetical protein
MSEVAYPPGEAGSTRSRTTTEEARAKMQGVAADVGEKAREAREGAGARVREEVDSRSTQAGEQLSSVVESVRKTANQLREDGNDAPAKYTEQVAERVEQLASYLRDADSDRMLRDVEDFGRRRPWAIALAGGVVGLIGARFLKASSSRRYEQSVRSGNGAGRRQITAPYEEL